MQECKFFEVFIKKKKKGTLLSNHYTPVFDKNLKQINNSYGKNIQRIHY